MKVMTKRKKEKGQREKRKFLENWKKERREEETGYERKEKSMNRGESG